ncbi:MAG: hypothetical protein ACR2HF_04735 [Methylococcaceae bacterium]
MLTKADFTQIIKDSIQQYPAIAPYYQAEDPRMLQSLEAMATMLALFSSQVEVAMSEPFEKARDSTVLADAALRGIIPKGSPARASIRISNGNSKPFIVADGRVLVDSDGREWQCVTPLTVEANSEAMAEAVQISETTLKHTVANSVPFYAIPIPNHANGLYLASIGISDSSGNAYEFRERYVNTMPDERVFHVESDDRQNLFIRLGYRNVVGYQPNDGEVFTLQLGYTVGSVQISPDQPLTFDYLLSPFDNYIELRTNSLLIPGKNPIDIPTLRDICRYPSVYDHSAVYLGEFDFVVRRSFPDLAFLSVWNEVVEESVRGAKLDNINTLFVAAASPDGDEITLTEGSDPYLIAEYQLTPLQRSIRQKILAADSSYRVRFYTPVKVALSLEIHAQVPTSYPAHTVRAQITAALLAEFGDASTSSRRGRNIPLYKQIYDLLRLKIPALAASNRSDARVLIGNDDSATRPENWLYLTESGLSITVTPINVVNAHWS